MHNPDAICYIREREANVEQDMARRVSVMNAVGTAGRPRYLLLAYIVLSQEIINLICLMSYALNLTRSHPTTLV